MEYRQLGRTGEKVPTIGMGTWRIGVYADSKERADQVKALQRGIELGMNLIDTAEVYASGKSEEVVGEAISGERDKVFLATKVSRENLRHDSVLTACEGSLRRLKTSYIDLYQVHWPDPSIPIEETMKAMEELVEQGKVRYIGVSNFGVELTEAARNSLSKNEIASDQVEYSLLSRSVESELLPYLKREKTTLIAYSPLARGNIRTRIPKAVLDKYAMSPAQAMLNWVTRDEQVVAIPKAAKIAHLEENASSVSKRLTAQEYESFTAG